MTATEIIESYDLICRLQSEVINELYSTLAQHIAADELPGVAKINEAAKIRATIGGV